MIRPGTPLVFLLPAALCLPLAAQAPGTHRITLGQLKITAIQDGELPLGKDLIKGLDTSEVERLLGGPGPVTTSVNAFLIEEGKRRILVDAGGTSAWGLGHLAERLKKAGIQPDSIDIVLLTHLHLDHFGGLLRPDGKRAFPRVQVRLSQAEHDYWTSPATEASTPEERKPVLKAMKATIAAYQAENAYHPFAPGEAPFPGVRAIPTPGHTPGHTSYAFGRGKHTFWAVGDVAHFGKVQFAKPSATVLFDTDRPKAAATRLSLWESAAKGKVVIGGSHLAFPGMGRIVKQSEGYAWIPLP